MPSRPPAATIYDASRPTAASIYQFWHNCVYPLLMECLTDPGKMPVQSFLFWLLTPHGPRPAACGRGTQIERGKALGRRQLELPPKPHPLGRWHRVPGPAELFRRARSRPITLRVVKHGQASRPPPRCAGQQPDQPGCGGLRRRVSGGPERLSGGRATWWPCAWWTLAACQSRGRVKSHDMYWRSRPATYWI